MTFRGSNFMKKSINCAIIILCIILFGYKINFLRAEIIKIPNSGEWQKAIGQLKPGQVGLLESGSYVGNKTISLKGTSEKPIIIRGAGHLNSIFDGKTKRKALGIEDSEHLIIENVIVSNRSPYGLDGTNNYSKKARNKLAEGIIIKGSSNITIRNSMFKDIATRGILSIKGTEKLKIEHNLFLRIGDDTASGDIAIGGTKARKHVISENIFAGNVDGIVFHSVGVGHIIERNIFCFEKWENCIDIKFHFARGDEDPWSIVRNNIIYANNSRISGIELQDSTDNIKIYQNAIYGAKTYGLQLRGRSGDLDNFEIIGNWFNADGDFKSTGIRAKAYKKNPGKISNVYILNNIFSGYKYAMNITNGQKIFIHNNIFDDSPISCRITNFEADTNLYYNTEVWSADKNPVVGKPIYKWKPVGPLVEGSPGYKSAKIINNHNWGTDIGLPQNTARFENLKKSILRSLEKIFTQKEIKACLDRGGVEY
jgi:hypothetical protein